LREREAYGHFKNQNITKKKRKDTPKRRTDAEKSRAGGGAFGIKFVAVGF
jgi:hypothetical protein